MGPYACCVGCYTALAAQAYTSVTALAVPKRHYVARIASRGLWEVVGVEQHICDTNSQDTAEAIADAMNKNSK